MYYGFVCCQHQSAVNKWLLPFFNCHHLTNHVVYLTYEFSGFHSKSGHFYQGQLKGPHRYTSTNKCGVYSYSTRNLWPPSPLCVTVCVCVCVCVKQKKGMGNKSRTIKRLINCFFFSYCLYRIISITLWGPTARTHTHTQGSAGIHTHLLVARDS